MQMFPARSDTIQCTLTKDELSDTRSAWQKLFRLALVARDEIPGGLRLVVNPASTEALGQLIDIERECCQWITFALDGPTVTMTAEGEGESVIRQTWVAETSEAD